MVEKTIQWFRNNWFLWVILILAYVTIRAFGYDIKVIDSNNNNKNNGVDWGKYKPVNDLYINTLDGFKSYMSDNGINTPDAILLSSGIYKTKNESIVDYRFIEKDSTTKLGTFEAE
jgi:hypothetical protein